MKSKLIYIAIMVGLFSCTDQFEEINQNPNNPVKVEPEFLLTTSLRETQNLYGGNMNGVVFYNYTHYFSGFQGEFQRYTYSVSSTNDYWRNNYVRCLMPVHQIVKLYEEDPSYKNRVIIAKIWKAYIFSNIVSVWGGVPMSAALEGTPGVAYEKEQDIYTALLDQLKELAEAIDLTGDTYKANADKIYGGDLMKWKKFAQTLRLRLAMRISAADPEKAKKIALEISRNATGIISSKAETAAMNWGITSDSWSYLYNRVVYNYTANKATIPVLCESLVYHTLPYNDARLPVYGQPAKQGPSIGKYFGQNISYGGGGGYTTRTNPHSLLKQDDYSYIGERFLQPDAEYVFLSYAEACFLKAEAALKGWWKDTNAQNYYYEGIDASYDHYGLSADQATAYKETPGIKWGTETDSTGRFYEFQDWMGICSSYIKANDFNRQIIMQHWLAMPNQGVDAWALIRRTRILEFQPQFATYDGEYAYIPDRIPYPGSEYSTNPLEVEKAVSWLGGPDGLFTKLWFGLPNVKNPNLPH
ncbi:MAG TPA: SusD/RagB family nutrient-binding outer membrane lipoprotein [Prolixibacteraceae bacterium]|nr:SusD/RagB family nutrient-binding outer membrane lipoprotein [Prolixibacteraceae bacterium]